ncbi:MAG: helix-turn-helix domain-containing protein [Kiritimatiellaeota bacterium]|nr:helix-turn-helix domain-containing protein [Kiritimatiellota bacterium]
MPNIMAALKQEITRLARKELRSQTHVLQKMSVQYRRNIADLKRQTAKLQGQVVVLEKAVLKQVPPLVTDAGQKIRFTAKGLLSQRKRLDLSAADYAKLVGASAISIYKWESGKVRPRQAQVAALAAVRGMSKKEALARLAQDAAKAKPAASQKKTKNLSVNRHS